MKSILKKIGFYLFAILIIIGGFQVLFGGLLETTSVSSSVYEFNGVERLMGLLPISFGLLLLYLLYTNQLKFDE